MIASRRERATARSTFGRINPTAWCRLARIEIDLADEVEIQPGKRDHEHAEPGALREDACSAEEKQQTVPAVAEYPVDKRHGAPASFV
jgi:hypothetical protein